ncbi:MAG: hypothetical protein Hals2KO_37850 [Halioglobus sp.]
MNRAHICLVAMLLWAGLLSGCGGGAGLASVLQSDPDGGIGGTGVTSSGTIDGFGSIFVNGIKFETDEARVLIGGSNARQDDLALGMVVVVTGTINADGRTGVATRVEYEEEVQGPIASITADADGDVLLLDVLGKLVIVERTGTVLDGVTFESLNVGDVVEVSGFTNEDDQVRATRVKKKADLFVGDNEVALKGAVEEVTDTQFRLGGIFINYDAADLSDIPNGMLTEGAEVEVRGEFTGSSIVANRVEEGIGLAAVFNADSELKVQGTVTGFVRPSQFRVNDVRVDARDAALYPEDFIVNDGMEVQVNGVWDGAALVAAEVRARRGRIKLEAAVVNVDTEASSITLGLFGGNVEFSLQADTRLNDATGMDESLSLSDITAGDFLSVEAVRATGRLVATRVDRIDYGDEVLQGPVERFAQGISVTLLGIDYVTLGTTFENGVDSAITPLDFYGQLREGDLVKIRDVQIADGRADVVEFEAAFALDGDRAFDGDCQPGQGAGESGSDGICGSQLTNSLVPSGFVLPQADQTNDKTYE